MGALDRGDLRAVADVYLASLDSTLPRCQDLFPASGGELDIAAQWQHARLGHHVLVMLVLLHRVGVLLRRLQQHVRQLLVRGPRRCAQSTRPRSNDGQLVRLFTNSRHALFPEQQSRPQPEAAALP